MLRISVTFVDSVWRMDELMGQPKITSKVNECGLCRHFGMRKIRDAKMSE
jgi:hypothetical protein